MRMDDPVEEYMIGWLIILVTALLLMLIGFAYQVLEDEIGMIAIIIGLITVPLLVIVPFAVMEGLFKVKDWIDHFR